MTAKTPGLTPEELERALARLERGELDALEPAQVSALEVWLNSDPGAAARLADCLPPAFSACPLAVPQPSARVWQRIWYEIRRSIAAAVVLRGHRFRVAAFAVAAALALAVGLVTLRQLGGQTDQHVLWARAIEVEELEVFEGATPLVLSAGLDDTIPVIWVLDSGG
jgi:hypothetical protein